MSIMVEYDLPEWCEGCNALSTVKRYVGDIDFPHYMTCEPLNLCDALRTHWKLDDKQPTTNCDKTQWISVKDKLPNNNERIIVIDEYRDMPKDAFDTLGTGLVNVEYGINVDGRCCRDYNVGYSEDKRVFVSGQNYCGRAERRTDE